MVSLEDAPNLFHDVTLVDGGRIEGMLDIGKAAGSALTLDAARCRKQPGSTPRLSRAAPLSPARLVKRPGHLDAGQGTRHGVQACRHHDGGAGTLALRGAGSLGNDAAPLALAAVGGTFDISAADGDRAIGALSGVAGSTVVLGANTLTLGDAGNQTMAGAIAGSGGIVKQGTGTLTLSGASGYAGGTSLKQGRIDLGHGGPWARARCAWTMAPRWVCRQQPDRGQRHRADRQE